MSENKVWTLPDAPEGVKPIECKWVFKKKTDMEGKVVTYKARLVAKGYRQRQGVDYDKTFSPVAMVKSIWILLAIAAYFDYEIWQMDVKTSFLNGNLTEEVYMTQPERYRFLIDDDQNITLSENDEPESYEEVLKSSECDLWLKAMKSEMDSMSENKVWTLSDAPEGVKPIG